MLEIESVRTFEDVRKAIDDKLGTGEGWSRAQVDAALEPVARVGWHLCEFFGFMRDFRHHIWIQGFAQGDFDGPATLARIAAAGHAVDPEVAELVAWTADRGRLVREDIYGEPLFSVVPHVWDPILARGIAWMESVLERWPDDLKPEALSPLQPSASKSAAGPIASDSEIALGAFERWRAGASNEELDQYFIDANDSAAALAGANDPLPGLLGVDAIPTNGVLTVPHAALEGLKESLSGDYSTLFVPDRDNVSVCDALRVVARMAPDIVLVDGAKIEGEDDETMIQTMGAVGIIVVVGRETA